MVTVGLNLAHEPVDAESDMDSDPLRRYLAHLRHVGLRPGSIAARRWCLLRLERHLATRLVNASADELYDFCANPALGPETRANTISHVAGFYRWAQAASLITTDPSVSLVRPKRPRRLPRPMPEHELRRALEAAREPIRSWLYLAAFAGLRCCEIAPLRGEDRTGDVLRIREQKGGDEGTVPISPVLGRALAHLPRAGWWFERWDGQGGAISAGQLQRHANRFLHDLGIVHTMHTLRHRFVTLAYRASSRDLRLTQELARHKSIGSTVGYTFLDPDDGRGVVARLPEPW